MNVLILIAVAYMLGSIPFGLLITKAKGIDIRRTGSGNIGATNVLRAAGKGPAIFTLIADMLKGTLPVILARYSGLDGWSLAAVGIASVIGHNHSVFLRFNGGKGVATSFGVLLGYEPVIFLISLFTWILVVYLSRISALGALVSFAIMPIFMYLIRGSKESVVMSVILMIMIYYRHKDNIKRLKMGKEPRIDTKN